MRFVILTDQSDFKKVAIRADLIEEVSELDRGCAVNFRASYDGATECSSFDVEESFPLVMSKIEAAQ